MSKGNLANTKVRSQLKKNKNDKGKNFYAYKNVNFNPASNVLTYEVEGKTKTANLSQEAAKNYMRYFRNCVNGYALDYFVKHQFKLNESTYRILKLATRFSTPAEIGEYIKSIDEKFKALLSKCGQPYRDAVKIVHEVLTKYYLKQSNSKISIIHDLFFPDITDQSSISGLVRGKEVRVFTSPYVDNVNYTTYADEEYRANKLIKVEFKAGQNISYDYFASLVCKSLYNKTKGQNINNMKNIIANQIRGLLYTAVNNTMLYKNVAGSLFFPYVADSYFKTTIQDIHNIHPSDKDLCEEIKDDDMIYEVVDVSNNRTWFSINYGAYNNTANKYKQYDPATIYKNVLFNATVFSNYPKDEPKKYALSSAVYYSIGENKNGGYFDMAGFLKKLGDQGIIVKDIVNDLTLRMIGYAIDNKLEYNVYRELTTSNLIDYLFRGNEPINLNVATTMTDENDKYKNVTDYQAKEIDEDAEVQHSKSGERRSIYYYLRDDYLTTANPSERWTDWRKVMSEKIGDKWYNWYRDVVPTSPSDYNENGVNKKELIITENEQPEPKEEKKEVKEEPKEEKPQPATEQPATENSGLSKRKLKKMGLSKRQIKKIMRIVDKPKGGVTENDTLNEIKELLKVMVGQVKPSAVNVADKPVDKLMTTNVKKTVDKNVQFNPSDVLGQRERLKPTTTVKYEPPKEFNLKSEIEEFDRDKLNHTMQGLAKVLKKGDITKQKSVIKKFKINPITAHLIKMVGTNQNAKKYMGGVFSKLASLLPYGSQIYDVAKRVYKVAKPVIEKVISKYDTAYDKKMNGYLSKNQLKSYLIKNEKPKLKTLNKILK